MAGYRIGPFDVESVLVTHDQVVEAAVIGVPDQLRGEVIEAFVVLRDPAGAPRTSQVNSSSWSRTSSLRTPTRAACISSARCRKPPAARPSDTFSVNNRAPPSPRHQRTRLRTERADSAGLSRGGGGQD